MSYYGKGGVSADFIGLARRRRQEDLPGVFQIYVSGCSGNITAGKYNDGAPENRAVLADRESTGRWPRPGTRPRGLRSIGSTSAPSRCGWNPGTGPASRSRTSRNDWRPTRNPSASASPRWA